MRFSFSKNNMKRFLQNLCTESTKQHEGIVSIPDIVSFDRIDLRCDLESAFQSIFSQLKISAISKGAYSYDLRVFSDKELYFPISKSLKSWWSKIDLKSTHYSVQAMRKYFMICVVNQIIIPMWKDFSDVSICLVEMNSDYYFRFEWDKKEEKGGCNEYNELRNNERFNVNGFNEGTNELSGFNEGLNGGECVKRLKRSE